MNKTQSMYSLNQPDLDDKVDERVSQEKILATMINDGFEERILDTKNYRERSVRGVFCDTEGKVVIIFSPKGHYYKLPGGGVEEGESNEQAIQREGKEETGVRTSSEVYIGTIVEQSKTGKVIQRNAGFLAKVKEKGEPELTEEEIQRGFTLSRLPLDETIELMTKNSPDSYRGTFMQKRDLRFLQEAKKYM